MPGMVNMAVDQHLLDEIEAGRLQRPVLRIYGWEKPTLSLGYHQQWRETVDEEALAQHGVELVRRWTGGRAVLHDTDEITYSVIAPFSEPFQAGISHNYALIGEALRIFTDLGHHHGAVFAAQGDPAKVRSMRHTPCFASLSQSEIETEGRKLIGSAQKLGKRAFLQHGSIPLRHRAGILEAVTGTELDMQRLMTSLEDHYAQAGASLPSRAQLEQRLTDAFSSAFGVTFEALAEQGLPNEKQVEALVCERFGSESWTKRK